MLPELSAQELNYIDMFLHSFHVQLLRAYFMQNIMLGMK